MTHLQTFFMVSGIFWWAAVIVVILGIFAYILIEGGTKPKSEPINTVGVQFVTYDKNGGKQIRREIYEDMKGKEGTK
jgi:hypothetical protein